MRLTEDEQVLIKRIIINVFGEDVGIWLFGSRVDDSKRGGDVDLYVVPAQRDDLFDKRITCLAKLEAVLPYPVDLVVADVPANRPIDRIAQKTGILL